MSHSEHGWLSYLSREEILTEGEMSMGRVVTPIAYREIIVIVIVAAFMMPGAIQAEQTGSARWRVSMSRSDCGPPVALASIAGTFGGGSGGGRPSILSRIHLPRATGEVRVETDVSVRKLRVPARRDAQDLRSQHV